MKTARRSVTAEELHRRAVLASEGGRPVRARDLLLRALDSDDARGALRVRVLVSLALAESEAGGLEDGLAVLARASDALAGVSDDEQRTQLSGLIHGQRGLLLLRCGRYPEAAEDLDRAVDELAWSPLQQARALLNRGTAALLQGDLRSAAGSLERTVHAASTADWEVGRAKAVGNLGYLAFLAGDLPEALRLTDEAAVVLAPLGSGVDGVGRINRARMLLASGLLTEAEAELQTAGDLLRGARLTQDRAEAELNRAEVALADGRPVDARRWAGLASRRFAERGSHVWALQCQLIRLQADRLQRRRLAQTAQAAADMVSPLVEQGLTEEARVADLIRLDCLVASSQPVEPPGLVRGERIGTRLLARAIRGDHAEARGDHRTAAGERSRGLVELHRYQARFGSLDLQSGASGLGRRLAADGLSAAVRTGRARQVLAWSERARATTSRTPALRPPDDPVAAEMLGELRFVRTSLHEAKLAGREDTDVRRLRLRRRELERSIRRRSWYAEGAGEVESPARAEQVQAALANAPGGSGTMISFLTVDGSLHALVVTPSRTLLRGLGSAAVVAERVQRLRADLDLLALSRLPAPVREVAERSWASGVAALQELLLAPLRAAGGAGGGLGDGPLLVVPSAEVAALPWPSLPLLRGRPVTVAPSATWWLAARSRGTGVPAAGRAVFVSGPGVERGHGEVTAAAAVWPGAILLTGSEATGQSMLTAADGADLLHIAAHGLHDGENPLFSSLQLADGQLFGYDLDSLGKVPQHVVLSACDLGLATLRRRDEAVGMTAALLHGGAVSVVAGMARVADAAAFDVGVRLHEGLRAGLGTAQALAAALPSGSEGGSTDGSDGVPAPLVCVGAGW